MRWCLLLLALSSCDWEHYALINSIPRRDTGEGSKEVSIFICADGVSRAAMDDARAQGAFKRFSLATSIPMYPATSDASWTRILHAPKFNGYEYAFFDPVEDRIVNKGLGGALIHLVPPFEGSPIPPPRYAEPPPYYRAFDIHSTDYLDAAYAYELPKLSFSRAMDGLFTLFDGRLGTSDTFAGYLLETDVMGHLTSREAEVELLVALSDRIEAFRANHPERTIKFTVITDHGIDHVKKPKEQVLSTPELATAAGVNVRESLFEARKAGSPYAVVVEHTRVTYFAVHTDGSQIDAVAQKLSARPEVDLIVARAEQPVGAPQVPVWTGLWKGGKRVALFGFDPALDLYWLSPTDDLTSLEVALSRGEGWTPFSDEQLFEATAAGRYPDLFFRARTALAPVSVRIPADLVGSLTSGFMASGFKIPGGEEAGTAGSHGAMGREASQGVLLTEERSLPAFVRSDEILGLLPKLRQHLVWKGIAIDPGDPNASLNR